jgi:hypothetical protein
MIVWKTEANPAPFIAVRVEIKPGSKSPFNQFIKASIVRESASWKEFFNNVIFPKMKENTFVLKKASVSGGSGQFIQVEVDINDAPSGILDMGITSLLIEGSTKTNPLSTVPASASPRTAVAANTLTASSPGHLSSSGIINSSVALMPSQLSLPEFRDNSRPAYSKLFASMRVNLLADGCPGFADPAVGKKFLLKLIKTLYTMSTFHDNLAKRGCQVPAYFLFSKGADDFRSKKNKVTVVCLYTMLKKKKKKQ